MSKIIKLSYLKLKFHFLSIDKTKESTTFCVKTRQCKLYTQVAKRPHNKEKEKDICIFLLIL